MRHVFAVAALAAAASMPVHAALFGFTDEFSGGTDCGFAASGCATLEVTASGATDTHFKLQGTMFAGEFVTSLYGNINPYSVPTVANLTGSGLASAEGFSFSQDAFKADGDGFFDWKLDLSSNPPRFNGSDTLEWDFIGVDIVEALSGISVNGPVGKTGFIFALHAQGLTGGRSGWFNATSLQGPPDDPPDDEPPNGVPEPGSLLLVGMGLLGLAALRRKS